MVGRRVNSFRFWSIGKSHLLLPEKGWRLGGRLADSYIVYILPNNWLFADGAFIDIGWIISLTNKTENKTIFFYIVCVVQSNDAWVDS